MAKEMFERDKVHMKLEERLRFAIREGGLTVRSGVVTRVSD